MTTFSILYHRYMSRPQEFRSELTDRDAALAEASAYIFNGWTLADCNPIAIIDWNSRTSNRIVYNEDMTAFDVGEATYFGINETKRFQLVYDSIGGPTFVFSERFEGFEIIATAAAYANTILDSRNQPYCLLDWQEKKIHHLIRDAETTVRIIQNYPDEPLGILTTYENMEL